MTAHVTTYRRSPLSELGSFLHARLRQQDRPSRTEVLYRLTRILDSGCYLTVHHVSCLSGRKYDAALDMLLELENALGLTILSLEEALSLSPPVQLHYSSGRPPRIFYRSDLRITPHPPESRFPEWFKSP